MIYKHENWGEDNEVENYTMEFDTKKKTSCLMLGYGALYNHSPSNNIYTEYGWNQTIIFFAKKAIKRHEEMFINYGSGWFDGRGFAELDHKTMKPKVQKKKVQKSGDKKGKKATNSSNIKKSKK